jgi:hypothetical protein
LGTARSKRLTKEPGRPVRWVEPNARREDITGERRPERESAGPIVAKKRGNARGAKEPYHSELE